MRKIHMTNIGSKNREIIMIVDDVHAPHFHSTSITSRHLALSAQGYDALIVIKWKYHPCLQVLLLGQPM